MEAHEFAARMQAPREGEAPQSVGGIAPCGHPVTVALLAGSDCPFCVDGAEAIALHERLDHQEREEGRRRERYPWLAA